MGVNKGLWAKRVSSKLGNRDPKRFPSKLLHPILWIDWPHYGPVGAKKLRPFLRSARLKEKALAWAREDF